MSNKMNVFDNVSLFAIPEASNHLVTKAYADSSLGASGTMIKTTNPVLSLTKAGQVFYLSLMSNASVAVDVSNYTFGTNEILEFTLIIFTTGASISFSGWSWHNGVTPDLSSAGWYAIHCTSLDAGANWLAKLEGSYGFPAKYKWVTTLSDATSHTGTSLRDAVGAASAGDMIMFVPGLEGTIVLEQGEIIPTKQITINGDNRITVDGDNASRIFAFTNSATANSEIKNITLTGGNGVGTTGRGNGGAVYATRVLTCTNVTLTGNNGGDDGTATTYGGAIYASDALTLSDCTITNNTITATTTAYGAALYTTNALTMTGCHVSGNSFAGTTKCGTIAVYTTSTHSSVNISNCEFTDTIGSGNVMGVALYLRGASNATFSDCSFTGNTDSYRGIVYLYGYNGMDTITFDRCLFSGNTGTYSSADGFVYLGAAYTVVDLNDCVFTGNSWSTSSGNHACVHQPSGASTVTAKNCTFTNNTNMMSFYGASVSGLTTTVHNTVDVGNGKARTKGTNATFTASHYLSDKSSDGHDIAYSSSLPLFTSDGYTPATGSQVIDAGDSTLVTSTTDFNGYERIQGDAVDLGAVEFLLPAIEGLRFTNASPQSNPIVYEDNATYPVDELVEVEGVEEGDDVNYSVENFLYGGSIPVIDAPGTYIVTVTVSRLGFRKSRSVNTVAIKKNNGTIRLLDDTVYAGDTNVVIASVPSDANGYLTCEIDGKTLTSPISNGAGAIELVDMPSGVFPILVIAHCTNYTDLVLSTTITSIISVTDNRNNSILTLSASDVYAGQNIVVGGIVSDGGSSSNVIVILPGEAPTPCSYNGTATCTFEGNTYTATVTDGEFTLSVPTTTAGSVTLNVGVSGSSNYKDATNSVSATVLAKVTPTLQLNTSDVAVGSNIIINGTVPSDYDGTASCTFEGTTYTASASNGSFQLSIPTTEGGTMVLTVSLAPTVKYNSTSNTATVVVSSVIPLTLTLNTPSDIYVGDTATISGSVSPTGITNGVATIVIDSTTTHTETIDSTGAFSKQITGLAAGEHTIEVTVSGDGCVADSDTTSVTVSKYSSVITAVSKDGISYGNYGLVTVDCPSYATGRCRGVLDDNEIYYADVLGPDTNKKAKIIIPEPSIGNHNVQATYEGDDRYLPSNTVTTSFSVKKKRSGPIS